jgi:hypothetical protein
VSAPRFLRDLHRLASRFSRLPPRNWPSAGARGVRVRVTPPTPRVPRPTCSLNVSGFVLFGVFQRVDRTRSGGIAVRVGPHTRHGRGRVCAGHRPVAERRVSFCKRLANTSRPSCDVGGVDIAFTRATRAPPVVVLCDVALDTPSGNLSRLREMSGGRVVSTNQGISAHRAARCRRSGAASRLWGRPHSDCPVTATLVR